MNDAVAPEDAAAPDRFLIALGAIDWRTPDAMDELTPPELQIAQTAAGGLSNREIGQRPYLSHRTVDSHLYRLFPKLGVTSRAELSGAL
jgi:DNA-binding NarL/FixJ family response regulator